VVGAARRSCHDPSDDQAYVRDLVLWDTFLFLRRGTFSARSCEKRVVTIDPSLPNDPYQILEEGDTVSRSFLEDVI
jgi:hypothetical protein